MGGGHELIVGSPPIWKDDSDATYAEFAGNYFGPGQPQFVGAAESVVDPAAQPVPSISEVVVRLRLKAVMGSSVKMPTVTLRENEVGGYSVATSYPDTTLAPLSPTWVDVPLSLTADQLLGLGQFPDTWMVRVTAGGYTGAVIPNETQRIAVYEVRLAVKVRSVAPPCRLFPRDDGLGVGSGRHFPSPKSQQRSARRFGYY